MIIMEFIHASIGLLEKCTKSNGDIYPSWDWRHFYCGKRGLIVIYMGSGDKGDVVAAHFFPDGYGRHLETAVGDLEFYGSSSYIISTQNSMYFFKEIGIDEDEGRLLFKTYNEMGVPKIVVEDAVSSSMELSRAAEIHSLGEER